MMAGAEVEVVAAVRGHRRSDRSGVVIPAIRAIGRQSGGGLKGRGAVGVVVMLRKWKCEGEGWRGWGLL